MAASFWILLIYIHIYSYDHYLWLAILTWESSQGAKGLLDPIYMYVRIHIPWASWSIKISRDISSSQDFIWRIKGFLIEQSDFGQIWSTWWRGKWKGMWICCVCLSFPPEVLNTIFCALKLVNTCNLYIYM